MPLPIAKEEEEENYLFWAMQDSMHTLIIAILKGRETHVKVKGKTTQTRKAQCNSNREQAK